MYILITVGYRDNLDCYSVLSLFFLIPCFMKNPSHYISSSGPSSSYTCWSSKPSLEYLSHQTPSLVLCDGGSFPLNIFRSISFSYVHEARSYHWNFLEGHFNCWITYFEPYSSSPRRSYSLNNLSFAPYLWDLVWEYLIIICSSSNPSISLNKA